MKRFASPLSFIGFWACLSLLTAGLTAGPVLAADGGAIVEKCFNYMRGQASIAEVEMVIHRPDWERRMVIKAWTKGDKESFFVIMSPPRDKGNGTLKKGRDMWIFNPKVNQTIKLPPSMMSQAWQGSDFSNNDLAKSDSLKLDYDHSIESEAAVDGQKIFIIKSMPKSGAPVIWGMQQLKIREDGILLEQIFFDEDLEPVKMLTLSQIASIDGKDYPMQWHMAKSDTEGEYTLVNYKSLVFKENLPDQYFTLSNLRNPRR